MITIFTTAKPFKGKARISQLNALRSWKALDPEIEVMLFGRGEGYDEASRELKLLHIPDVEVSARGTPLVSSMFAIAGARGKYELQAYINCDIILTEDFLLAARRIDLKRFMMIGQRWDMDVDEEMDFKTGLWQKKLKDKMRPESLHPPTGCDYFLFRRGTWKDLPPLIVGRASYDNWLIYYCRSNGISVIDASDVVTAIHQNHDYSHLKKGKEEAWSGSEARNNFSLTGGYDTIFTIIDADMRITEKGLVKNYCRGDLYRFFEVKMILNKDSGWGRFGLFGLRTANSLFKRLPIHGRQKA
ncbi:MAG: hypothetical protein HY893_05595 [Deltaproteobacteria bacterium]|nr:hypothetical protein [Deltaproteobacteria bacterium]